jgi:hypothetical protein
MPHTSPPSGEIIIEYVTKERFVKVSAIDTRTSEEASVIGDVRHSKHVLAQMAIKKLRRMQLSKSS